MDDFEKSHGMNRARSRLGQRREGSSRCPYCRAEFDATAAKCRHCGEWVNEGERINRIQEQDQGLSGGEVVGYGLLFFVLPCVSMIIAHVLYYGWKVTSPKKAQQINTLSIGCFLLQVGAFCVGFAAAYAMESGFRGR
jgi:hypothetical protein